MLIDNVLSLIENVELLNKLKLKKIINAIKKDEELKDAIVDNTGEVSEDKITSLIQSMM